MRVALIFPKWEAASHYAPLGLTYLASVIEIRRPQHKVRIFDFSVHSNQSLESEFSEVVKFLPDIVGISVMTHAYYRALDVVRLSKKHLNAKIVLGGPHPTIMPEKILKENHEIDFIVIGEGEQTFVELLDHLSGKRSPASIDGLVYLKNGRILKNQNRKLIVDLDQLPNPARHLLKIKDYPMFTDDGQPMTNVLTTRGCPYGCTFCYKGLFGRRYRERSAKNIIKELEHIIKYYSIRNFYFIDDLFVFNLDRLNEFLDIILERNMQIGWCCLGRVDRVNKQILQKMKRAGCWKIHYGIESGDDDILKRIKKQITTQQVREAIHLTKQAGIKTKGYFMTGLPGDTLETVQKTIHFAKELDVDEALFSITTPMPGTELWEELLENNPHILIDDILERAHYGSEYVEDLQDEEIMHNQSNVDTNELIKLTNETNEFFIDRARRRKAEKIFGKTVGYIVWQLYNVSVFRKALRRSYFIYRCVLEK